MPQHRCARCGYDLRRASTITIGPGAKWFDRCIDDICRPEALTSSPAGRALIRRLLSVEFRLYLNHFSISLVSCNKAEYVYSHTHNFKKLDPGRMEKWFNSCRESTSQDIAAIERGTLYDCNWPEALSPVFPVQRYFVASITACGTFRKLIAIRL